MKFLKTIRFLVLLVLAAFTQASLAAQNADQKATTPSYQYSAFALRACDTVEENLPETERVAQIVAARYLAGGQIGVVTNGQGLSEELVGRAGGLMHIGFGRPWSQIPRTPEEDAQNVALVGWERAPGPTELAQLQSLHAKGTFLIGFGARDMPELAEPIKLCDAFFDTGLGADDRVVRLPNGKQAGHGNLLVNMLRGWSLIAEVVAALTQQGKMPVMYMAYLYPDGKDWAAKYYGKAQFHDDYTIAPIEKGALSRAFLGEIRGDITCWRNTQEAQVQQAATLIAEESKAGRKTVVAMQGHVPSTQVGHYEDAQWAAPIDFDAAVPSWVERYRKTPDGALVLRLGYSGLHRDEAQLFAEKKQRVLLVTALGDPRPEYQILRDLALVMDAGWAYGDAAVSIAGYPIKILPPSGILQIVAYESINTEVLARLAKVHREVACKRGDFLRKLTSGLVAKYDHLGIED